VTWTVLGTSGLLGSAGALGVFVAIFAETGLLIGFFLPGDTLLFAAGLLCATAPHARGHLSLPAVLIAAAAGALAGAQAGYLIGRHAGPLLLDRPGRDRLRRGAARARAVIDRYGVRRALVLARFVPLVRTAVSPLAGATGMPVLTFTIWQVAGGLLWSLGITLAGYALGTRVPGASRVLLPATGLLLAASPLPYVVQVIRRRRRARAGRK
jgi:membrane-associated protein